MIECLKSLLRGEIAATGTFTSAAANRIRFGRWGAWAKLVEGTASLLGSDAALEALKAAEQQGVQEYETALNKGGLDAECRTLIRVKSLRQTQAHIASLDRMMTSKRSD